MKYLTGLIMGILIAGAVSGQHGNAPAGHIALGIKGGLNVYNIHNNNDISYDTKSGFHFGLLGHIHFDSQFAIQPEIFYSAQGAKNGDAKINLDYVNVPVLFQYMFDNGFRIQAGPQFGFLVSAKSKNNNTTINIKDNYKPIDLGASIGASYIVPSTGFGIDARYNFGLSNINKNGTVNSFNRGVQLGLFYLFGHNSRISL